MHGRVLNFWVLCSVFLFISIFTTAPKISAQQSVGVSVGDTIMQLSGKSSPGSFVSVYIGTSLIGTMTVASSGDFSQAFPAQTPGVNRINLSVQDSSGRLSDTATIEVNLEQHFTTNVHFFLPTTLDIASSSLTDNQPLHLYGQTIPGGIVTIYIDNQVSGSAQAGTNGSWEYIFTPTNLSSGAHGVFARVSDSIGNQSFPTREQSFTVLRQAPVPLPLSPSPGPVPTIIPYQPSIPQILSPSQNQVVKQGRVTVSGQTVARTQVEVWEGSQLLGTVWSDFSGAWSLPYTFSDGTHTIRSRSCLAGRCSVFSNEVEFIYKTPSTTSVRLQASLEKTTYNTLPADKNGSVRLRLQVDEGSPPFIISIDWGDGTKVTTSRSMRSITLTHRYEKEGKYTGRIVIRNSLGSQELFFAVNVSFENVSIIRRPEFLGIISLTTLFASYFIYRLTMRIPSNHANKVSKRAK